MIPYEVKVGIENINKTKMNILNCLIILCHKSNYENCEQFEKEFAELIGRKYAICVANATILYIFIKK